MISEVYNMDCMEYMKSIPDKFFELAIVDPPYGIGEDWKKRNKGASFKKHLTKTNQFHQKIILINYLECHKML